MGVDLKNPNYGTGSGLNDKIDGESRAALPPYVAKSQEAKQPVQINMDSINKAAQEVADQISTTGGVQSKSLGVGSGPVAPSGGTTPPSGEYNAFLSPGVLVAIFRSMTSVMNAMTQVALANAETRFLMMQGALDMAKSQADAIKNAALQEMGMYIASGIASVVEVATSIITIAGSMKTAGQANKEATANKAALQDDVTKAQTKLDTHNANAPVRPDPPGPNATRMERQQYNQDLQQYKRDVAKHDNVSHDLDRQKLKAENTRDTYHVELKAAEIKQEKMMFYNALQTAISKLADAGANFAKAGLVVQKSEYEAEKTILEAQMQNYMKMIDSANEQIAASHDLISKCLEAMQKASADSRKLGGSIGIQAAG